MIDYYYIDDSGFIDYAGKFGSQEKVDDFLEDNQINSFMLFHEEYLEDFITFAKQAIKLKREKETNI